MQQTDFLIAGGGLAGLTLAYSISEISDASILVIDDNDEMAASAVAAGILNPVTGRRHVKTWNADEFFPVAFAFYRKLELLSEEKFFFPLPIAKIYDSIKTKNDWQARSSDTGYEKYIGREFHEKEFDGMVNCPLGGIYLQYSALVKTNECLSALKKILKTRNVKFEKRNFSYDEFRLEDGQLIFTEADAGMVVFCEGWKMIHNPFFNHHQMIPVKGDLLMIESEELKVDCILMGECFICPQGGNKFLAGTTYEWNFSDTKPDFKAKEKIEKSIRKLLRVPYRVTAHRSGIRPAMQSRRPVAQLHSQIRNAAAFNGLGTKGYLLAPYFSKQLAMTLIEHQKKNK